MHMTLSRLLPRALRVNPVLILILFLLMLSSAHGQMPHPTRFDKISKTYYKDPQHPCGLHLNP